MMAAFIRHWFTSMVLALGLFLLIHFMGVSGKQCLENCDTKICKYISGEKVCRCLRLMDYTTGESVEQLDNNGYCISRVDQLCTLPDANWDGLAWQIKCVDNAQCIFAPNGISPRELYGVCKCNNGYLSTQNRTFCKEQPTLNIYQIKTLTKPTVEQIPPKEIISNQILTPPTSSKTVDSFIRNSTHLPNNINPAETSIISLADSVEQTNTIYPNRKILSSSSVCVLHNSFSVFLYLFVLVL